MDWRRQGAALLAGGTSVLAYAPFGIFPLAFVSLGLLFWLLAGLKRHASGVKLRRFDETDSQIEASFQVAFADVSQVEACLQHFRTTHAETRIRFVDDRGIGN